MSNFAHFLDIDVWIKFYSFKWLADLWTNFYVNFMMILKYTSISILLNLEINNIISMVLLICVWKTKTKRIIIYQNNSKM